MTSRISIPTWDTVTRESFAALVKAVVADHRIHVKTGSCPQCGAGPPPHHAEDCALARFDFEDGDDE